MYKIYKQIIKHHRRLIKMSYDGMIQPAYLDEKCETKSWYLSI